MKKILLLGGSSQQVIAIETAKRLGYYTILCDYLTDNPGQYEADKFYLISTTDKEKVLEIAKIEKIDGILAYASDPAAPTAAYVAEKMQLPGNPYKSVDILCNKDKFRNFLKENKFNVPNAKGYSNIDGAKYDIKNGLFKFPIIIKPVDSSGSKGATVVKNMGDLDKALEFAISYSRDYRIIVEEYIEKKHKYLIGGDIFVNNGEVVLWGLLNCHRDNKVNSLVPVGKSYPPELSDSDISKVKETLQNMINKLNIKNGAMNVELIIDNKNEVYLIDIGPRNGGNMIPDLLGYIFNLDVVEITIQTAMGKDVRINVGLPKLYYATHNLHSSKNGILDEIIFSSDIEKYIIRKNLYKKKGDVIEYFDNASKALGIIFMKFPNIESMKYILDSISTKIDVRVRKQ